MKPLRGREIYKEAFTTNKIYVFDENVKNWLNPDRLNVHVLFKADGAKVYEKIYLSTLIQVKRRSNAPYMIQIRRASVKARAMI